MGKKAKLKQIRRIAAQMPEIQTRKVVGEKLLGAELYKSGVEEVEGKAVNPDILYSKKSIVEAPLNHNRKMKQLYNKYGKAGVNAYIQLVNRHISAQKTQ
jgi:hypothetical protein